VKPVTATLTLSPQLADALAAAVANGVPIETAAIAAGIGPRTFYEWLSGANTGRWSTGEPISEGTKTSLSRFSQQIAKAQAEFEAKQVAGIARAAEEANEKTGQTDWRARAWLLNNHPRTRARYRQENHTTIDQTVTHRREDSLALEAEQRGDLEQLEQWAAYPELPSSTSPTNQTS
jgi:hypothetical protein